MKRHLYHFLLFFLPVLTSSAGADDSSHLPTKEGVAQFAEGDDTILFYGNSMIERLLEQGELEARLQIAQPNAGLKIRSLAWTGDDNPLSPPWIPPISVIHGLSAKSKFLGAEYDEKAGYELAGFVWLQGFNDLVDGQTYPNENYDEYSRLLAHFIRDVRKDLSAPKMPFVIGVLGVDGEDKNVNFRKAMAAFNFPHL